MTTKSLILIGLLATASLEGSPTPLTGDRFYCGDGSDTPRYVAYRCDGVRNCADGSDEKGCYGTTPRPEHGPSTRSVRCPTIVGREEWGARSSKQELQKIRYPVTTVVIHHTQDPPKCDTSEACIRTMKSIQNYHQDEKKWSDIGYNFVVGGDGRVYTARGWRVVGAHAPPFNHQSIGISLIGNFTETAPPDQMLIATKQLIQCGLDIDAIDMSYQLIGHNQAAKSINKTTACPGEALYNVIKNWYRWTETPAKPATIA